MLGKTHNLRLFCWKLLHNHYIYYVFIYSYSMKKGFTLLEMVIVLMIIGILMAATMRFWSNRIVDLKAQSIKEQFVGYYNEFYSQNITSSFRDGQKYEKLTIVFATWVYYSIDSWSMIDSKLSNLAIKNLRFDPTWTSFGIAKISFIPYVLWCSISNGSTTWSVLYFDFIVPENGKKYCFEITSETCKLVEQHCD